MQNLAVEMQKMRGMRIGESNPFPEMKTDDFIQGNVKMDFEDDTMFVGYGRVRSVLPYKMQDTYTEEEEMLNVKTIVLENDVLKAVFLPEYGCRLWRLYHKKEKRDLLFTNASLKFGNLAIRNAWFAGGVEWNMGICGHSPFTCDSVFCEKITDRETGAPALKFYEWERKRGAWYEVIAYLPEGSELLYVKVKIINCRDEVTPMYWWSNIAVEENVSTRTITNAEETYVHGYGGKISLQKIPYIGGDDISYAARGRSAKDYFFRTKDNAQHYIVTVDHSGNGLMQTSTGRLKGRKLFLWGMGNGGRNWQRLLSGDARSYIEIQAGLARTQSECLPMQPHETWQWLEAYGAAKTDPELAFSFDWNETVAHATETVESMITEQQLNAELERAVKNYDGVQGELLHSGSGWAALENERLIAQTGSGLYGNMNVSHAYLTEEQRPWMELLQTGNFVRPESVTEHPAGFQCQPQWVDLLMKNKDNWYAQFHMGVIWYANDEYEKAETAFEESVQLRENPWALHALAHIKRKHGRGDEAYACICKALELMPNHLQLIRDLFQIVCDTKRFEEFILRYECMPEPLRKVGRIKYMAAVCYAELDRVDECERLIYEKFRVTDIREGELSLEYLWQTYCVKKHHIHLQGEELKRFIKEKYPAPYWLSYNMAG